MQAVHAEVWVDEGGSMTASEGLTDDVCYDAVVARNAVFDGRFFYAVRTTGVFCKPSCGSRTPKRENVSFHESVEAATAAGFRACRRCKPEQASSDVHAEVVIAACRMLDEAVATDAAIPTLDVLAQRTGYSKFHLHRLFTKATGLTPRAYAAGARARRMQGQLATRRTVSEAIHGAGYSSSSRFYEQATPRLGMAPGRAQRGGAGERIQFAVGESALGPILVAATERGICAIQFGDDAESLVHALERRFPQAELVGDDPSFDALVARVVGLVEHPSVSHQLPLDIRGTAFQERVWRALTAIPAGTTVTYASLAASIGQAKAVRAVARACAANEIAVAVPCHRVVRTSGALAGYRWGVARKAELLRSERGDR